jgi:hypothetical protein
VFPLVPSFHITSSGHQGLLYHERKHRNEKSHVCGVCKAGFFDSSSLLRHQRCHNGQKPYACKLCPAAFSNTSSLTYHTRTHLGIKHYRCSSRLLVSQAFILGCGGGQMSTSLLYVQSKGGNGNSGHICGFSLGTPAFLQPTLNNGCSLLNGTNERLYQNYLPLHHTSSSIQEILS